MKKPANVLTLRVPQELKERLVKASEAQGVSMNQLAVYALTRELSTLETIQWFHEATDGVAVPQILQEMDAILQKVPVRPVPAWDRLTADSDLAKE